MPGLLTPGQGIRFHSDDIETIDNFAALHLLLTGPFASVEKIVTSNKHFV
jgi:hypothetical protein